MKYWLLTTEYPPFFGGGISTYCFHTARMLAGKGHHVSVFINDVKIGKTKIEEHENIRIIRFNPSRANASSFLGHVTNISYEFAHVVKQFIEKEGKPDLIEAQEYLGIAYYLLQYKYLLYDWCRDVPVLITMHSPSQLYMEYNHVPLYKYPNFWVCEMERFCLQAATHIISPSKYMISELERRFHLAHERITVVSNPFALENTDVKISDIKIPGEIVFYGKLSAQKGAFELLRYFSDLWDKGFSRPLYVIGGQDIVYHPEGKSMGVLLRKKYSKYIDKGLLIFENRIKPSEIADRLSRAEVVVVPSNNDNQPYVVLELMALGKLLLVSKQGGQAEIVEHGENGFVFDHNRPESFAEQLQHILDLPSSRRGMISSRAVERIKDGHGYDEVYSRKFAVIQSLLQTIAGSGNMFPFVRSVEGKPLYIGEPLSGNEKLSVVMPYYNMGRFIDDAISSVKKSDYPDIEIIIVNDGSTEPESLAKLETYRKDPGIKIIDSSNQGLASARNLGAAEATGKFLAFLDSDDKVIPGYYSRAVLVLRQYQNLHFVGCWTQYFENSNSAWPAFQPEPPLILFHNLVNSSSLIYKRQSFLAAGQNDKHMIFQGLEDYESVISMTSAGLKGAVIPELLFLYRVRQDSMIRDISKTKKILLYQYISIKHKEFYAKFADEIFNLTNANGPGLMLDNPSLDLHLADRIPFGSKISLKLIRIIKKNRHLKTAAYKIYSYIKK